MMDETVNNSPAGTIKPQPRWLKFVPVLGDGLAFAMYPNVYVPEDIFNDLHSGNPSILNRSIIVHEQVHIARQKDLGVRAYARRYALDRAFRLEEELLAIKEQMVFLKAHGEVYDIERKAIQLSSVTYIWASSYGNAKALLAELWERT